MKDLMFYLAGPYTHKSKKVMKERELALTILAGQLHDRGITVYSPITHSARIAKVMGWKNTSFEKYEKDDLTILSRCDGLIVLKMDGWEESKGVDAEINHAIFNERMTIFHLDYPYDEVDIHILLNQINMFNRRKNEETE